MKKLRLKGFDFRILSVWALLILSACSTGMDAEEGGEMDDSEVPAETAEASPTDAVPEEVAAADVPAEEVPPAQEAPPAPAEEQVAAQAPVESVPAESPPPAEAAPPVPAETSVAAAEPVPVADPAPASGEGASYTVKSGDTLMKISWEQYGTLFRWREIYKMNQGRISDPNQVPPGTQILLPSEGRNPAAAAERNGDQYLIVSGDTLGKISNKVYGTIEKWKKLWENNRQLIRDPNRIYAGF